MVARAPWRHRCLANFDLVGDRIAALVPAADPDRQTPNHVTVLFNFFDELRRRVTGVAR